MVSLWNFFVVIASLLPMVSAQAQTTLTVAYPLDTTGILKEALADLDERLSRRSDGQARLNTIILPGGDAQEGVRLVHEGKTELALIPVGEAIELSDKFAVFEVPFLFDNLGAVDRFIDTAEGQIVLQSLREYGLVGLGLVHKDMRDIKGAGVNSDPQSLRGKSLGVDERANIRPFDSLGTRSISRPSSSSHDHFLAGRIDAIETTVPDLVRSRDLQSKGELVVTDHRYEGWVLAANRGWLRSLSETSRRQLRDILQTWLSVQSDQADGRISDQLAGLSTYTDLDYRDKEPWRDAFVRALRRYIELIGADIVDAARRANIMSQGPNELVAPEDHRPMDLKPIQRKARQSQTPLPWDAENQEDFTPVQLLFGTDRQYQDRDDRPTFTGDRGRVLTLGSVVVTIPRTHDLGAIERPSSYLFGLITLSEDEREHIVMRAPVVLSEEEFTAELRTMVNKSAAKKQAFVFVHGFNVTFDEAAWRTAQIAYDLEFDGAALFYSWPSRGNPEAYVYDQDSARQARDTLQEFLELVRFQSGADVVHLIGHSMGTNPLMEAVSEMWEDRPADDARPIFNQIILAAADIDRDVFFDLAEQVDGSAEALTLYASAKDRALELSEAIRMGSAFRAGHVSDEGPTVHDAVDTIDATDLNTSYFALGHSDYAEHVELMTDIRELFAKGTRPPDARTEKMMPRPGADNHTYWVYRP